MNHEFEGAANDSSAPVDGDVRDDAPRRHDAGAAADGERERDYDEHSTAGK